MMKFRRSVIITELWWSVVARRWKKFHFLRGFFEKWPLMGKFSKFCSKRIRCNTNRHVVLKFHEIWLMGNRYTVVRYLPDKNFCLAHQFSLLHRSPGPAPDNVLRVLQISSKLVHFWHSYIRTREHHQSALESESSIRRKPSFEPDNERVLTSF